MEKGDVEEKLTAFWTPRLCPSQATYPVQDVCPALHGDALKHGEHGKGKVIEVGDASVWANPATPALRAVGGTLASIP